MNNINLHGGMTATIKTIILLLFVCFAATTAYAQTSGSCGATLNWNYNEATQTLAISGTGDMYDSLIYQFSQLNLLLMKKTLF
jgi:uncharacterized protein YraI